MKKILLFILVSCTLGVMAQYQRIPVDPSLYQKRDLSIKPVHSSVIVTPCSGEIKSAGEVPEWNRRLIRYEKKHVLPAWIQAEVDRKTSEKLMDKGRYSSEEPLMPTLAPEIGANFHGNSFDGFTPPDNHIAIADNGTIVSVMNSNIEYYDPQGILYYSKSFTDFFGNDPDLTGTIYDPVVLYDSQTSHFFMAVLHGSESNISMVLAAFSKSTDISDGWWYYKLTGNPVANGCWFDYPKVGVSNNEVYITGNLFSDADEFQQTVVYQIKKAEGYAGSNITWQYWTGLSNSPFTLVPTSFGHQGNIGPGIYFISTQDLQTGDKILLFDLTNDIGSNPEINVYTTVTDFSVAGDALQKGSIVKLNNDDARGLHAFYLNGIIHFTYHSDREGGYAGLNYNRLDVSNMELWHSIYGMEGYDYSYPSVASFTGDPANKSVMISFLRSGSDIYPECRVVYVDNDGNWSNSQLVKEGETYVDVYQSNQKTRWGDYTGIARRHNGTNPEVWLSGCYGHFGGNEHSFDTWIAQVKGLSIGIDDKQPSAINAKIAPNPVRDIFSIDFDIPESEQIRISLLDMTGKEVKLLFEDKVRSGKNNFSFNKGALSKGEYLLLIKSSSKTIANEKIIIL